MPSLSIILSCRVSGNPNNFLKDFFQSCTETVSDPKKIEFLIKLDEDDCFLKELVSLIEEQKNNYGRVRYLVSKRGRGYRALHIFYKSLLKIASENSSAVWILTDDVLMLRREWDKTILDLPERYKSSYYTIYPTVRKRGFYDDAKDLLGITPQQPFECFPVMSRKFADVFNFGNSPFTDASTSIIEHFLYKDYGIDNTILPLREGGEKFLRRRLCPADQPGSYKYDVIRSEENRKLFSPESLSALRGVAQKIYEGISSELNSTVELVNA